MEKIVKIHLPSLLNSELAVVVGNNLDRVKASDVKVLHFQKCFERLNASVPDLQQMKVQVKARVTRRKKGTVVEKRVVNSLHTAENVK